MLTTTGSMEVSEMLPSTLSMRSTDQPPVGFVRRTVGNVVPVPMGTPSWRGSASFG